MNDPLENQIRRDNHESNRRKSGLLRDILMTWSDSTLEDTIGPRTTSELVDEVLDRGCLDDKKREAIMREPQYAELRRKALLSDDLECIRLCGGAKTPAEERQLYLDTLAGAR